MKRLSVLALTLALGLSSVAVLRAQDEPTTKPARPPVRMAGVTGIFALMPSLTTEQRTKIATLHSEALAKKKEIDQQEMADSLALLTPEQKAEYEKIEADRKGARRRTPAARKPTTEPS